MKRNKIDLSQERKIIINMIVSTTFLTQIYLLIKPKYFKSSYARMVSGWIIEYYNQFKECPGKNIKEIYERKRKSISDEDDTEIIQEFLQRLSEDWESNRIQNTDFSIKTAVDYLKLRSLELVKDKLENAISEGNSLHGEQIISNYNRVEQSLSDGVYLFKEPHKILDAFDYTEERLFQFPGALGGVGGHFLRGDLVAFLAASNRGKTWWQWFALQMAVYNSWKTVFFSLEMPIDQIVRRGWQSFNSAPREDMEVQIPCFVKDNEKYIVDFKKEFRKGISTDIEVIKKQQKNFKMQFRSGEVRVISLPHYEATIDDINAHLDNLEYYDNYIPDVIIVDYADIIAPSKFNRDYRHQLDEIWKGLRRLAEKKSCLVVTASQTGRKAFKKDADEEDIAEDIRKIAQVSKMFALNQTEDEYEKGIMRVKSLKERDGKRSYKQAVVLQCLELGRPYVDSKMRGEVDL